MARNILRHIGNVLYIFALFQMKKQVMEQTPVLTSWASPLLHLCWHFNSSLYLHHEDHMVLNWIKIPCWNINMKSTWNLCCKLFRIDNNCALVCSILSDIIIGIIINISRITLHVLTYSYRLIYPDCLYNLCPL